MFSVHYVDGLVISASWESWLRLLSHADLFPQHHVDSWQRCVVLTATLPEPRPLNARSLFLLFRPVYTHFVEPVMAKKALGFRRYGITQLEQSLCPGGQKVRKIEANLLKLKG